MLLTIDIGNTNIKLGLFDGDEIRAHWRLATMRERLADEYAMLLLTLLASVGLRKEEISGCAISSVVPVLTQEFTELSRRYLHLEPVVVGPNVQTGLLIRTDYPAEVGPDLIVNVLAARHLYGAPVIVIGFGTATTFSVVSPEGDFAGVAIAPGVGTAADALFRAAARLPQVELAAPPAESVLREYLKNHPEHRGPPNADTEAAAANLSNTVVTQASAAVREAWALRRLAQDYGAREMPVNAAPKLQAMAHDHACAIREYVERAGATISLVFGQPRPPVTASAGPWPQTVQQIFRSAEDLEARVGLLFAGDASSVPADVARRLAEDPQTAAREMLALVAHIIGHLDAMSPP